ncbi:MAG: SAF domain-containing protein [Myxococcaceae bacterium]
MRLNLKALLLSWLFTVLVVTCGTAGLGVLWAKRVIGDRKRGWVEVKTVVATRDLPAGTVLSAADIAPGTTIEQLSMSTLNEAELGASLGKRLDVPVVKGDPLVRWMLIERPLPKSCFDQAQEAARQAKLEDSPDVKEALAGISKRSAGGSDGK